MYPNYKVKTSLGGPGHPHCCNMLGNMLQLLIPGIPGNPERWQALPDIQTFVHLCPLESAMSQNNSIQCIQQFMVWITCSTLQYYIANDHPLGSTGHQRIRLDRWDWSKAFHQPRKLALQGTAFRWDMVRIVGLCGTRNALMTTNFGGSTILLHILRLEKEWDRPSSRLTLALHQATAPLVLAIGECSWKVPFKQRSGGYPRNQHEPLRGWLNMSKYI